MSEDSTPRVAVFTLPDHIEDDDTCINNRYQFKDRQLIVSESDGAKLTKVLCRYYNCGHELVALKRAAAAKGSSLAKESTQGGAAQGPSAADKVIADKAAADKVIADKAAADKVIADKAAADKVIADKAAAAKKKT